MNRDRGQSTVELALALPLLCLFISGLLQVAVVVRDQLAVQLAAREAARAASVSADPVGAATRAARQAVRLAPLEVELRLNDESVTARVAYVDHTDVPLIGALLPDIDVAAEVTVALEPPDDGAPPEQPP